MSEPISFATRLWFAWACFFRVLFDAAFAERAWSVRDALGPAPTRSPSPAPLPAPAPAHAPARASTTDGALQLLALLQREGRLVDFLEQDIASFPDADVGAAARAVHTGCRKTLRAHATIAPLRAEDEGAKITLEAGFAPAEVKLSGNVQGSPPYRGTLVHRGWRASKLTLPTALEGHDFHVLAPAEVEI